MFRETRSNPQPSSNEDKEIGLKKIVCGGQTGVDRAALDAAILLDIEYGGWCPQDRLDETLNETGRIPEKYIHLKEVSGEFKDKKENFDTRTKQNIKDSNATLIIVPEEPMPKKIQDGTKIMEAEAIKQNKLYLIISLSESHEMNSSLLANWIETKKIKTLNIGGPRESNCPGIYQSSLELFKVALPRCKHRVTLRAEISTRKTF
ncbi:MAG: putative molybdenum carrier protein [Gammaproteobacteria bacterium]